ncbi:hypothetical protein HW511_00365 [Asaia siamensis]|uniref:Uncharacterized protein n=1 Tax=Asaia siamensis TaxID=110479 RepID=A0ABQ1M444_9PROT|nr:hypothetical protein [Asaia siamensis]GBR06347.1 hypothetical protein AA0323_1361 [Asaia siamensis NRIC 0323]GGC34378.1 hypothetical protein GCM10007207_19910 [Asaia siamensis]
MSADPSNHQPSEVPEALNLEACHAASLEFQSVCDRYDLSVSQRLDLLADMTARAAHEIAGRDPGWQHAARIVLETMQRHARTRLQHLTGMA